MSLVTVAVYCRGRPLSDGSGTAATAAALVQLLPCAIHRNTIEQPQTCTTVTTLLPLHKYLATKLPKHPAATSPTIAQLWQHLHPHHSSALFLRQGPVDNQGRGSFFQLTRLLFREKLVPIYFFRNMTWVKWCFRRAFFSWKSEWYYFFLKKNRPPPTPDYQLVATLSVLNNPYWNLLL